MSGAWSGGAANRSWGRQGYRPELVDGDEQRGARLFAELAAESFLCETCGRRHALAEHRDCRQSN